MRKGKTLKDLLSALKKLSPEELKRPIMYSSEELSISGYVTGFGKSRANLLWNGDDDPSEIKTKNSWQEDGYSDEEIDQIEVAIRKGDFVINF